MTVLGSYRIIRQIGEGGFGRTYEARHILLDEKACLKQNLHLTDADAALLRQEAKLLWQVHHHSLPALRDFFAAPDDSYVLAMTFIEGKGLDKVVAKHTAIHPEDVAWVGQRLFNALYYLHSHGIIHGDVKPSNVIVQPAEHNAVLIDYGLSTLRPTHASRSAGYTAVFSAPEVVNGKPPLPESDLYSLGLTMMYALGGDPLTKTLPNHVPDPLRKFCEDLTATDPRTRPRWEHDDLVSRLSEVRLTAFGRKSTA